MAICHAFRDLPNERETFAHLRGSLLVHCANGRKISSTAPLDKTKTTRRRATVSDLMIFFSILVAKSKSEENSIVIERMDVLCKEKSVASNFGQISICQ